MRKISGNKKGDSTIIAVVLLTVIVVGLGALLFTFFRGQIMGMQEKTSEKIEQTMCSSDLSISLATMSDGNKACYNYTNGVAKAFVEAGPSGDIDGVMITVIGEKVGSEYNETVITKGTTEEVTITLTGDSKSTEAASQIKITPKMTKDGKDIICPDAAVTVNEDYIGSTLC